MQSQQQRMIRKVGCHLHRDDDSQMKVTSVSGCMIYVNHVTSMARTTISSVLTVSIKDIIVRAIISLVSTSL